MKIGVLVLLTDEIEKEIKKVHDFGLTSCQLCSTTPDHFTQEMADRLVKASKEYDVEVSAFWCSWSGPRVWDFYSGPHTLGLVPSEFRSMRLEELKRGSDFAKMAGIPQLITHVGFIPEVPTSTEYHSLICAVRHLANYCKNNGQLFLFETGQETPVTLRRAIEDVGTDNLGINLDSANLILYGKANPIDALDVFGEFVRNTHIKDGFYPTDGKNLGKEVQVGEGKVNFPVYLKKLKSLGYDGCLTIEREISGDQQIEDIRKTKVYLEKLLEEI